MTDPTEQTVGDAMHAFIAREVGWDAGVPMRNQAEDALEAIGLTDPSMPVDRLRADLAIAARARACVPDHGCVHAGGKAHGKAKSLLAYLLNGEQP